MSNTIDFHSNALGPEHTDWAKAAENFRKFSVWMDALERGLPDPPFVLLIGSPTDLTYCQVIWDKTDKLAGRQRMVSWGGVKTYETDRTPPGWVLILLDTGGRDPIQPRWLSVQDVLTDILNKEKAGR